MKNWRHLLIALLALVMLLVCGGVVMAEVESKELPPLPKEIADVVGELPTSLDDLPEGFDAAQFKAVYDAVDLEKVVSELLESGSSTFSDGGVAWDIPDLRFYLEDNVTFVGVSLSAADNGQMTVKLNDALPGDGEFDEYEFSIHSKDRDYVASVDAYDIGTPDESKSFKLYRMSYIKATDGKEWCIRLDKNGFGIEFTLSTDNPYRQWTISFNEQGEIDDTYYYADEEEAQPAEAEQPTYTVDDYIGTWYMKLWYLAERGVTMDPVAQYGLDPYKNALTIEPGKVTFEYEDSSEPSTFEGELKIVDGALCVMMDEENYYSNARFLIVDNEDGRYLAWLPSSGDIYYYSREASKGPGKVHKDKATVKAAQQALNDAGYECGKPDGAAGKKTKAAITQYQTDKGLEVTGTVTDELLRSLGID